MTNSRVGRARALFTTSWFVIGIVAVPFAGSAFAQSASNDQSTTQQQAEGAMTTAQLSHGNADDIVVIGTRASLQSAIARKKNAGTVVDSIVAEDISQFPDKNIGEALQRITGVQLTRDFGEGTQVSIRGVEPDLNRVEINGVTLLGQGARASAARTSASWRPSL
ncbi:TonB-dependent receptor plug domain-containing protein [Pedomonas mirosovicensis]|uniref:TonB-dependent receptor plug domain-containing protein n=1 Tax=Pedomonas mirosovicensis TaxID=2908641 RepID=UPI00216A5850|nr:TonB-dependent receptor plug domain-containing protein [Pedomonas mirosovicensis]MCH8686178.1 TonB-dependent receptor plug domain-containing protein [Pedomonas mirosovicensis]